VQSSVCWMRTEASQPLIDELCQIFAVNEWSRICFTALVLHIWFVHWGKRLLLDRLSSATFSGKNGPSRAIFKQTIGNAWMLVELICGPEALVRCLRGISITSWAHRSRFEKFGYSMLWMIPRWLPRSWHGFTSSRNRDILFSQSYFSAWWPSPIPSLVANHRLWARIDRLSAISRSVKCQCSGTLSVWNDGFHSSSS
jgi:hypothetical protein